MTQWNPSAPARVGPEVQPSSIKRAIGFGSLADAVVQRFTSTVAETISSVVLYGRRVPGAGSTPQPLIAEIVTGQPAQPAYTETVLTPNADGPTAGTVTGTFASINDWTASPHADWLTIGEGSRAEYRFDSAAFPAARRVYAVVVDLWTTYKPGDEAAGPSWGTLASARRAIVSLRNGGSGYGAVTRTIPLNDRQGLGGTATVEWGEINPITGLPWTQADIVALSSGTTTVRLARKSNDAGPLLISAMKIRVFHAPEDRVGIAMLDSSAFVESDTGVHDWCLQRNLITPWVKPAAGTFTFVWRRANVGDLATGDQRAEGTVIDLAEAPATSVVTNRRVRIERLGGLKVSAFGATADPAQRLSPFIMRGGALPGFISVDSQPYATVAAVSTRTMRIATVGALSVGGAIVSVFVNARPTGPCRLAVKTGAGVVMGYLTAQPQDVTVLGRPAPVTFRADWPIALGAATAYDVSIEASAATYGWSLSLLDNGGYGPTGTYRDLGGDIVAGADGGGDSVALYTTQAVAAPTNFNAAPIAREIDPVACEIDSLPELGLAWTIPAPIGVTFARVEIERRDDVDTTWRQVAQSLAEATVTWTDREHRLGTRSAYRSRVVLTDGRPSPWTDDFDDYLLPSVVPAGAGVNVAANALHSGLADFTVVAEVRWPTVGANPARLVGNLSGNTGWAIEVATGGFLRFVFGTGAAQVTVTSPVAITPPVGQRMWLAVNRLGPATPWVHSFYVSVDGVAWSLLGSVNHASAMTASAAALRIGSRDVALGNGYRWDQAIYRIGMLSAGFGAGRWLIDFRRSFDDQAASLVGLLDFGATLPVALAGAGVYTGDPNQSQKPTLSGPAYVFSSNLTAAWVVAPDTYESGAARPYEFPEAAERIVRYFYGRRLPVVFRPVVDRGEQFARTLNVASLRACGVASRSVVGQGPDAFDDLRALSISSTLPYVCVRDEAGNRWFGSVGVGSGTEHRNPSVTHTAEVDVIETVEAPTIAIAPGP